VIVGLFKTDKLVPGSGFLNATVTLAGKGPGSPAVEGRVEAGWKPAPGASLFAFTAAQAQMNQPLSWQAGLGARVEW
jgi:hypothetical protein